MPRQRHSLQWTQLLSSLFLTSTLLLLPTSTTALSLGDFAPRATGLTSACNSVYNAQIPGCTNADFTSGSCSSTCIGALVTISTDVYLACNAYTQDEQMLIAAFLAGTGISSICPNVVVTTISGGVVSVAPTTSEDWSSTTLTVSPMVTSGAVTVSQTTAIPTSILVDTSSSPRVSPTFRSTTATSSSQPSTELTTTIKSTVVVIVDSTSVKSTISASASSSISKSSPVSTSSSTVVSSTSSAAVTSSPISTVTLVTTTSSVSGSSSISPVPTLSSSTDCQHAGDPFQYCGSAASSWQPKTLGILSTIIVTIWMLSWATSG